MTAEVFSHTSQLTCAQETNGSHLLYEFCLFLLLFLSWPGFILILFFYPRLTMYFRSY